MTRTFDMVNGTPVRERLSPELVADLEAAMGKLEEREWRAAERKTGKDRA